jgi:hypothetical protein
MTFYKSHKAGVLQRAHLKPYFSRDGIAEKYFDVGSQTLGDIHKTTFYIVMRGVKMENQETDKLGFILSHGVNGEVWIWIQHAAEFGLLERLRPEVPMIRIETKKILHAANGHHGARRWR